MTCRFRAAQVKPILQKLLYTTDSATTLYLGFADYAAPYTNANVYNPTLPNVFQAGDFADNAGFVTATYSVSSGIAPGNTFYVSTTGSDSNNGSKTTPKRTITAALNVAQAGDKVLVAQGTYSDHISISTGKQVYGGYSSDFSARNPAVYVTTIDGGGTGNVVTHGGTAALPHRVIDGFVIQNGQYGFNLTSNTDIPISDCVVRNNRGSSAAGIYAGGGNLTVLNCAITGNAGYGILQQGSTSSIIANNTISGNQYGIGGYGSSVISGNTISSNVTTGMYGGGIDLNGPSLLIESNTITSNASGYTRAAVPPQCQRQRPQQRDRS